MKIQGTQSTKPKELEINVDTVYVRSNITRIETEDFTGWEYDEIQYDKNEYIEMISTENKQLKDAQADTNNNLLDLMETIFIS
nr:hypothetical protein [Heyndrickxia oleronia]